MTIKKDADLIPENFLEFIDLYGDINSPGLFVKGDQKVDLTTDGFMNARSNPDKLKEKIKETVDSLLI